MWRKENPSALLVGHKLVQTLWTIMEGPQTIKNRTII